MIKAWIKMWKSTFDYKGVATQKEFWLGAIANVFFMYLAAIPYALIFGRLLKVPLVPLLIVFFIVILLPEVSLYVRRARDAGWSTFTTVWLAVCIPIVSGILAGVLPTAPRDENGQVPKGRPNLLGYGMAFGIGLYIYGAVIGMAFFDGNFEALSGVISVGLLIAAAPLIVLAFIFWAGRIKAFFKK